MIGLLTVVAMLQANAQGQVLDSRLGHGGQYEWKMCRADEVRSAARELSAAGYDDSSWEEARPYTFFEVTKPIAPFALEPRTIPPMEHYRRSFTEVVCVRESCARKKEELKEEWERLLSGKAPVEIPANSTYIVELSAGEEMCGYPSLAMAGGKQPEKANDAIMAVKTEIEKQS